MRNLPVFAGKANLSLTSFRQLERGRHLHFFGVAWGNLSFGLVWSVPIDRSKFTRTQSVTIQVGEEAAP